MSGRACNPSLVPEAEALGLRLENVAAVREAVENGPRLPFAVEYLGPLLERHEYMRRSLAGFKRRLTPRGMVCPPLVSAAPDCRSERGLFKGGHVGYKHVLKKPLPD